jgi:hypothetical protein
MPEPPDWNPAQGQPAYWQPMPGGAGGVPPRSPVRKRLLIALLVFVVIAGTGVALAVTFALADGAMSPGPSFGATGENSVRPLTVQFAGDKIVQFGLPDEPVTVWQ